MFTTEVDTQAKSKGFMPINLQLFAEGEPAPVAVPQAETQAPLQGNLDSASVTQRLTALFDGDMTDNQAVAQQPVTQTEPVPTQATQAETLLAGKYKTVDDLVGAYQNIQSEFTRKAQSASEAQRYADTLKTENESLTARLAELSQSGQGQAQQQDQQLTDDFEGLDTQDLLDRFYENPRDIIAKAVQKAMEPLMQKVNPVVETVNAQMKRDNWNEATRDFVSEHADMSDFTEEMKQYIQERELGNSDNPKQVLSDAYMFARGMKYTPPQQVDPKAFLQDQNFVNENILNNPEIVNMILQKQMQQINSQQVPVSIGGQVSGQAAAMPQTKPSNMREANALFENMFARGLV